MAIVRKHNASLTKLSQTLRKNQTKQEKILWYEFLSKSQHKWVRQKALGNYIADFYCAEAKLVIELDGSQHYEQQNITKDLIRTEFLEQYGLLVLRIPNNYIQRKTLSFLCEYIDDLVVKRIEEIDKEGK